MRILLSNDDGYSAQGIQCLRNALKSVADVIVVAPKHNCSACSSLLTVRSSMILEEHSEHDFILDGTPSDCVRVGLSGYVCDPVDMVVSGINHGPNLALDVIYSGTVAAAQEAAIQGVPGVAISLAGTDLRHLKSASQMAVNLIQHLSANHPDPHRVLNINIPGCAKEEIAGIAMTKLGKYNRSLPISMEHDHTGNRIFNHGPLKDPDDMTAGTDTRAVLDKKISLTLLSLDRTHSSLDYEQLAFELNETLI